MYQQHKAFDERDLHWVVGNTGNHSRQSLRQSNLDLLYRRSLLEHGRVDPRCVDLSSRGGFMVNQTMDRQLNRR